MNPHRIVYVLFTAYGVIFAHSNNCVPKDFGNDGTVCVCNATYCDFMPPIKKIKSPNVLVYTSNRNGLRFHKTTTAFESHREEDIDIVIEQHKSFQKIEGFGGAFTDATGININSLSNDARKHLLRSYFSKDGIEYNLCRIPIGATDFSLEPYSYDDGQPDPELKWFSLSRYDYKYKIPFITEAQNIAHNKLRFIATAWVAPKWMKTNRQYVGGSIEPQMYRIWANYHLKFLNAYKRYGINFWGMTTGNEPSLAKFPGVLLNLPSVNWTPYTMATWVAEDLGPVLQQNGYENVNIIALDDQKYHIPWFMYLVFANKQAKKFIHGTAVHWYFSNIIPPLLLTLLHNSYPNKFILSTEASTGYFFPDHGVTLGSWSRAEDYATDIIEDLQNWVVAWIDWNMALNVTGGPTYANNLVDSPIIVNKVTNEFYKQPTFYALGHFSKFIPRGSTIIDSGRSSEVFTIAAIRPDKGVAIVILNKNDYDVKVVILDKSKGTITLNLSAHSITSVVYW